MNLFSSTAQQEQQPLAYRMRPRSLDEYIGQDHIVGNGRLLRRAIQADQLSSVIFYGPPGTGKTTLARVIANTTKSHFSTLNAVLSGVKQLREEIDEAKRRLTYHSKRTILFIDEVHRWNKSQQDALLPWVENGTIILIGATTENPYFEVNAALVSRSRIFQLKPLTEEDLLTIAQQAILDKERGYGSYQIRFEDGALEHIVQIANGDARSLLNALELAVETTPSIFPPEPGTKIYITQEIAEESIQKKVVLYDKEGDYHFDVISAFIKSIRGSDPDATLYWLARMVRAGEDPKYIFRRMLISACEDIGMADPHALGIVESAAAAFDRVGMPEGRFHLTHAALYLSTAPKSNSGLGFFSVLKQLETETHKEVPNHLRDGNRDKEGFGHGQGYQYPHAFQDHWVAQQYLPDGLQGKVFYTPSDEGYEKTIKLKVERHREAQLEAATTDSFPEILTFSPPDSQKDQWLQRLITERGAQYEHIRTAVFSSLPLQRHHHVLVIEQGRGLLLWEACRRTPEGGVVAITSQSEHAEQLHRYANHLPMLDRPTIKQLELDDIESCFDSTTRFEAIIGQNVFTRLSRRSAAAAHLHALCAPGGNFSFCEIIPKECQRLSELCSDPSARDLLREAEHYMYHDMQNSMVNFDGETLTHILSEAGFTDLSARTHTFQERRLLVPADVERWIEVSYTPFLAPASHSELQKIKQDLIDRYGDQTVNWRISQCFISGTRVT